MEERKEGRGDTVVKVSEFHKESRFKELECCQETEGGNERLST